MDDRFTDSGMLKIPSAVEEVPDNPERVSEITVSGAFCECGESLLDLENCFDGAPGIRIGFRRPNGEKGIFVASPKINDVSKKVLEGEVVTGEKAQLFCPECGKPFPVLAPCDRCKDGDMVVIFCSRDFDISSSVSFCNIFGCPNAMLIQSDKVIRAMERDAYGPV